MSELQSELQCELQCEAQSEVRATGAMSSLPPPTPGRGGAAFKQQRGASQVLRLNLGAASRG